MDETKDVVLALITTIKELCVENAELKAEITRLKETKIAPEIKWIPAPTQPTIGNQQCPNCFKTGTSISMCLNTHCPYKMSVQD